MSVKSESNSDIFKVTMFGSFDIEYNGKHMVYNITRSKKLSLLLAFLLCNKGKIISQNDIINNIWVEGSSIDPANALKNLIYRLRKVLVKDSGFPNLEYIVFSKNTYYWNPKIKTETDIDEFLKCVQNSSVPSISEKDKLNYSTKAINLYKGEFLSSFDSENWVIPLAAYYFNLFLSCVYGMIEINKKNKKYSENIELCYKALSYDPFEEKIHLYLMNNFVYGGLINKAVEHYEYISDMFHKELGIFPSDELKLAYKNIISKIDLEESDLETIKNDLKENTVKEGAYFCDYDTFKHIYRIESRSLSRNEQSIFIGLLTIADMNIGSSDKSIRKYVRELGDCIMRCIRNGDIMSKYSTNQYIIMLKSITLENSEMVMNRITNNFFKKQNRKRFNITYKLQALEPLNEFNKFKFIESEN